MISNLINKVIGLHPYYSFKTINCQHFAFMGKSLKKMDTSMGISYNFSRPSSCMKCMHAEENAVKRFLKNNYKFSKNKKIKVDLLVVRVTYSGELKNSKPCRHCVEMLSQLPYITVVNVYYSTKDGNIVCEKFKDLLSNIEMCTITRGNL